ncbi:MAG: AAA family ATPase [Ruminiclostridium sp.]|nr:AAA family ATPase [Ruminiclostridium sp.]
MQNLSISSYIRFISLTENIVSMPDQYPFSLDAVKNLKELELHPKVTFLVGENGTGKSTLLEAVAVAFGFNAEGGTRNFNFASRETHSCLNQYIKLTKGPFRPRDGFFFRAESFYNVATNIDDLDNIPAFSPPLKYSYGGVSLHEMSHGESFFAVFLNRFSGNGLYILDEPEAALSPNRQMAMISRMHQLANQNSQFIIATHSPIIMAYPDAFIYKVDEGYKRVEYQETEHYQVTRTFLNDPERMLNILMNED